MSEKSRRINIKAASLLLILQLEISALSGFAGALFKGETAGAAASRILYAASFIIPIVIGKRVFKAAELKSYNKRPAKGSFITVIICIAFSVAAMQLNMTVNEILRRPGFSSGTGGRAIIQNGFSGILLSILLYVLLPVFCEELFLRWTVTDLIGGGLPAVIFCGVANGLLTFNPRQFIYAALAGMAAGYAAYRCASIRSALIIRAFMNSAALFLSYMYINLGAGEYILLESLFWTVLLIAGGCGILTALRRGYNIKENEMKSGFGLKQAFSPLMIFYYLAAIALTAVRFI